MQATIDTNENLIKIDFIATGSDLDDGKGKKKFCFLNFDFKTVASPKLCLPALCLLLDNYLY